jgi:antitoxin CptB
VQELNRLRWMCRRGMKELDVLLLRFLEQHYPAADASAQQAFAQMLEMQDPDIHALLLGRGQTKDSELSNVIAILRQSGG